MRVSMCSCFSYQSGTFYRWKFTFGCYGLLVVGFGHTHAVASTCLLGLGAQCVCTSPRGLGLELSLAFAPEVKELP